MIKRKVKCGVYNMAWRNWQDAINTGIAAEKTGHRAQFFTDQMVAYLFRKTSVPVFGEETMLTGREKGIQWRDAGFVHPLGDEFGYARKLRPEKMQIEQLRRAVTEVPPEAVMNSACIPVPRSRLRRS